MGVIAEAVRHMLAAGMAADDVVRAISDMESASGVHDASAERRRAADRERKREVRLRKSAEICGVLRTSAESTDPSPEERKVSPCTPSKETQPSHSDADASGAAAPQAPAYTDARHELWAEGKPILESLGIKSGQSGKMIGQWLKATGDDCAGVLDAIQRAREARPHDPIPWITRALPTKANHDRQPQRHQHELSVAFDKLRDHAQRLEDAHPASSGWGRQ